VGSARAAVPPGRIYLVRHGLVHNPNRIAYGWLPRFRLTEEGRVQASATAAYLAGTGARLILTSPLLRAVQTARIIATALPGVPVRRSRLLIESGLAHFWEGLPWAIIPERHPEVWRVWQERPSACTAGESIAAQAERMRRAVLLALRLSGGGPAICISHRDPILALRFACGGGAFDDLHTTETAPASVTILRYDGHTLRFEGYCEPYRDADGVAAGS